jgi:hypothetical protein
MPVGYGGLIYNLLNPGKIMALQVLASSSASPPPPFSPSSPGLNFSSTVISEDG